MKIPLDPPFSKGEEACGASSCELFRGIKANDLWPGNRAINCTPTGHFGSNGLSGLNGTKAAGDSAHFIAFSKRASQPVPLAASFRCFRIVSLVGVLLRLISKVSLLKQLGSLPA